MFSSTNEQRLSIAELNRLLTPVSVDEIHLVETRSIIKSQLIDLVSTAHASNVVIVGEQGSGKSSLLSKSLSEIVLLPQVEHFQLSIIDGNQAPGWLFRAVGRAISGHLDLGNNREDLAKQMIEFSAYSKKMVFSIDALESIENSVFISEYRNFNSFVYSRGISAHLIGALGNVSPSQMVAELLKSKVTAVRLLPMKQTEIVQVIADKLVSFPSLKNKNQEAYQQIANKCEGNPSLAIQLLFGLLSEGEYSHSQSKEEKKKLDTEQKKSKPSTVKKQKSSFDDFLNTETKADKSAKKVK
jgi:hypothetical protein